MVGVAGGYSASSRGGPRGASMSALSRSASRFDLGSIIRGQGGSKFDQVLPEDSASQVGWCDDATTTLASEEAVSGGEHSGLPGKGLERVKTLTAKLPLNGIMTIGKFGVFKHHAQDALRKMTKDEDQSRARVLKKHLELVAVAESLHEDNIDTLQEVECHKAMATINGAISIPSEHNIAMFR